MKKQLLSSAIALFLLFPLYSHAQEGLYLSATATIKTTIKESSVKETNKDKDVKETPSKEKDLKEAKEVKEGSVKDYVIELETTSSSTPVAVVSPAKNFTLCSQEAIEVRDTNIATSRSLYNTGMASALNDRKNKEKAAVAISDETAKKAAIRVSVDTYKSLVRNAQNNLTVSRKSAWQGFEADIKECRDTQDNELSIEKDKQDTKTLSGTSTVKADEGDVKTLKETIKAGIDSLRSLFNN